MFFVLISKTLFKIKNFIFQPEFNLLYLLESYRNVYRKSIEKREFHDENVFLKAYTKAKNV